VRALDALPDAADEAGVYAGSVEPWCRRASGSPHRDDRRRSCSSLDDFVRGDLHCHTTWSDGKASVLEMGEAAIALGYEYVAICDHTTNVPVVPGLDADAVRRQGEEIAEANERLAPFRVLRGIECDILPDGSLDLPDDVLAELDWVQLSLHAGQRQAGPELTRKVTEAMRHPSVRCLSHPTGRLINHRPPNALDLERAIEVALEEGVALEVNGLAGPARPRATSTCAWRSRRRCRSASTRTRTRSGGSGTCRLASRTARRGVRRSSGDVLNTKPLGAGRSRCGSASPGAAARGTIVTKSSRTGTDPARASEVPSAPGGGWIHHSPPQGVGETVRSGGARFALARRRPLRRSYQCVSRRRGATPGSVCSP
jgi:DNA polymerase (family 10)